MHTWTRLRAALLVVLCAAALGACGSSSSSSSSSSATSASSTPAATSSSTTGSSTSGSSRQSASADPAVEKLVPAAIKSKGTLTVASDASYAPNEFFAPDRHTVIGMDPDLAKALAAVIGLKAKVGNAIFASIIPGLAAGKYDLGASSFTDTKAREQTVEFVDYFEAGESFYTKAPGGATVSTIADICGKTLSVENASTEQSDAQS